MPHINKRKFIIHVYYEYIYMLILYLCIYIYTLCYINLHALIAYYFNMILPVYVVLSYIFFVPQRKLS